MAWQLTWDVLLYVLRTNLTMILTLIAVAAVNPLIKIIVGKLAVHKKYIKMRFLWGVFELWELLTQVAAGIVKSIVRFVMVIVAVLFSLPRIDRSPFPAWIEYYLLLDTGSKSYQGMICMYHVHNNPVMRVACWILLEDSRDRRDATKRAARSLVTPRQRRFANMWRKIYFLVHNPKLIQFVAGNQINDKARHAALSPSRSAPCSPWHAPARALRSRGSRAHMRCGGVAGAQEARQEEDGHHRGDRPAGRVQYGGGGQREAQAAQGCECVEGLYRNAISGARERECVLRPKGLRRGMVERWEAAAKLRLTSV